MMITNRVFRLNNLINIGRRTISSTSTLNIKESTYNIRKIVLMNQD